MIRHAVAALCIISLSACAHAPAPEPIIVTKQVNVAVPVPCDAAKKLGPKPVYPDTDAALRAAPNIFERVKLLVAGRLLRIHRELESDAALQACEG